MNVQSVSCELGGRTLTIESGKLAKQANGSVMVSYGDTRVLVTVCCAKEAKPGQSFFPLTVEFSERFYAAGKIPGGFLKREGRPTNDATLSARMIDRPLRPLFPEGFLCDTQIIATIMSLDKEADTDICAAVGASAALHISDVPFNGPTAACRVGRIDGKLVVAPTWEDIKEGKTDMEILVAGTKNGITMVEGGAREVPEAEVLEAILQGHEEIKKMVAIVEELRDKVGVPKREFVAEETDKSVVAQVEEKAKALLEKALQTTEKQQRYNLIDEAKKATLEALVTEDMKAQDADGAAKKEGDVKAAFEGLKYDLMRGMILDKGVRIDGRDTKKVRPIWTETGILPRPHGSSVFTRGETQVLAAVTLGTGDDEQMIDSIFENTTRQFMLHYNFPPYSVGETGRYGGQSRREIGHGALAERAVSAMLPKHDEFPYTIRIVCETLESNGSSSMGSVCSASMALMNAGVPMPKPIAGIAMGLIKEGDKTAVLSDILGDEDHLGDMDFKVAGTADGITAIQMDIKIDGVDRQILETALAQANEGRKHILAEMGKTIEKPNELSDFAPRITSIQIPVDKIGMVVGPGGKMIKSIIADTGCSVDINDDGKVNVASNDAAAVKQAIEIIEGIVAEVELNQTYKGTVKKITDFGAFIGVLPNQDGLLHISEIAYERVERVEDVMKEGDEVEVKVIEIDPSGKVRLSRKALLPMPEGYVPPPPRSGGRGRPRMGGRPPRGGGGRGRGGDRGGRGARA